MHALIFAYSVLFLSTLSLWRATPEESGQRHLQSNFYPRSPCGERQEKNNGHETAPNISIHALLVESDVLMLS